MTHRLPPIRTAGADALRHPAGPVDYSAVDLLPPWRRDNQFQVQRVVVYDPRSLARVWILDETTDDDLAAPYRTPHPDMTLAQSAEARRRLQSLKAQDWTGRRLFDNLAEIRAIEAGARTTTTRRKAERTRQAGKAVLTETAKPCSPRR